MPNNNNNQQQNYHGAQEWIQNYDFVDIPPTNAAFVRLENRKSGDFRLSGKLNVVLKTVDPLFIGSGYQELERTGGQNGQQQLFVKQPLTEHGKPVIPGSSLKGAVRHICRAVSESCAPKNYQYEKIVNGKRIIVTAPTILPEGTKSECKRKDGDTPSDTSCIVCDMFGKMGWSSKLFFSDLLADTAETVRCRAASQFQPHPDEQHYLEGGFHKYKFYFTDIREGDRNTPMYDQLRAVPAGTVFRGEIVYRNLCRKELELLMFGLGQSRSISLKLGGYRNEGFGTVNLTVTSDSIPKPSALAIDYINASDDTLYQHIDRLEKILTYRGDAE